MYYTIKHVSIRVGEKQISKHGQSGGNNYSHLNSFHNHGKQLSVTHMSHFVIHTAHMQM